MKKILLIDDDADILFYVEEALIEAGYTVVTANNGKTGLTLFQEQDDIKLVVTDMVMPEMGGKELIKIIRKMDHDIPIIAISGDIETLKSSWKFKSINLIQKPFDPEEIVIAVQGVT
tara:strand:+ start:182 stop:532 length:351 start_codon:yes stop_codon:yes gene_type:complete